MKRQRTVEVRGDHEDPNGEFGAGAAYVLVGDTVFGWRTAAVAGPIALRGFRFLLDTGGGNRTVVSGAISGPGAFEWRGGGVPQVAPSILESRCDAPLHVSQGVLDLAPGGRLTGALTIGGRGPAQVAASRAGQLDGASVALVGDGPNALRLTGDHALGTLTLAGHATLEIRGRVAFADSRAQPWNPGATLTVDAGRGARLTLPLAPAQLARVGFAAPDGLRHARLRGDALVPGARVRPTNPPFDLSPRAAAARRRLYDVDGLARLARSPLQDGATVVFFGDSITWQGGYIDAIGRALAGKKVRLVNRGINGGGALQLRDGAAEGGFPGSSPQKPLATLLETDRADIAVVYIGINDAWWRNTSPAAFAQALRALADACRARNIPLVLATPGLHGERPDGKNADDAKIDALCEAVRRVARESGATLVDLRRALIACLQNRNATLRVDGSVYSAPQGVLTYDGVHPSADGVALLASLLADGIARAVR